MIEWAAALGRIALPLLLVALFVWLSFRSTKRKLVTDGPDDEPYRIYTREYDLVLRAEEVLPRLPSASPDGGFSFLDGARVWERAVAEMEDMLAEQRAAPAIDDQLARLSEAAQGLDPRAVAVTMLIDQSGSMKGGRIASVATAATLLTDLLGRFGASVEVLGFSTAGWRGGHPRSKWLDAGRPGRPGRLCALMHIIYKSADDSELSVEARRIMVHPDLLRENVDGEAILWARDRMVARPESHRLLMVISDGAPVDDSTLASNGPSYLYRHLMTVLREIEADALFTIGGVGIGHDVERLFWLAETAPTPADVPKATMRLLEQMLRNVVEPEPPHDRSVEKEKAGFPRSQE